MDGGTVWNVNVDSVITQCLDGVVEEEKDIILDIVVCGYSTNSGGSVSEKAAQNWLTAYQERGYYTSTNSIQYAREAYPDVEFRYYFQRHNTNCTVPSSLDFRNETTWCLQEAGRSDAKEMLEVGQDKIHATLDEWYASQELQKEHPTMISYIWESLGL